MNTARYKHLPLSALAAFLLLAGSFSCTERMDLSTEVSDPRLVIYGSISADASRPSIKITRSQAYFATTKPDGISDATVTISGGGETFILTESHSEPGLYTTERRAEGKEGETYTLNISLDFDGDGQQEEYEATSFLPYAAQVDSIDFQPSVFFDDMIEVMVWGRLPTSDENYLSIKLYRNYNLVNDSLDGIFILDDKYIVEKEMIAVPCFYLDQDEDEEQILPGDRITLRIESITKEYATFLENAQSEAWGNDPIFSGPPANVETNITCKTPGTATLISGFFFACSGAEVTRVY